MPVIGATQLEPVNILGSYIQGLEGGRQARAQRAKEAQAVEMQNMLRAASAEQLRSPEFINRLAITPGGADIAKVLSDQAAAQRTAAKDDLDLIVKRGEVVAREAGAFLADPSLLNKAAIDSWAQTAVQRNLMDPAAYQRFQELPDDPRILSAAMKKLQFQGAGIGDQLRQTSVSAEAMLPYTQTLSPEKLAEQKDLRASGASRQIVQLPPGESAYQTTAGKATFESDLSAFDAAQKAADDLLKDFTTLDLLETGKATTGITAELVLGIDRIKTAVAGDKEAAKRVSDTELLNALLGSDVFSNIQALGIGARGLDTPAEREFLREVISGMITMNPQTLRRMAEIRANVKERAIERFNKRVDSGELDRFFKATGRPKSKIEKPERPAAPGAAPAGVPPDLWSAMTPEERALWQKKR